mgnify:CR=1 FL=1
MEDEELPPGAKPSDRVCVSCKNQFPVSNFYIKDPKVNRISTKCKSCEQTIKNYGYLRIKIKTILTKNLGKTLTERSII